MGAGRPSVPPLRFKRIALIIRTVPLIRHASHDTFPQGKALRAADSRPYMYPEAILFYRRGRTLAGPHTRRVQEAAPYSPAPTAPTRPSQARKWNRSSRNFPPDQAPVGRKGMQKATPFLRAGNDAQSLRSASSVTGDRGKGEYGRISAHPEPSPGDSLVTFSSLRKSLAAGAAKSPPHSLNGNEKRRRGQAPALPRICALTCPLIRPF